MSCSRWRKVDGTWIAYGLGNQVARHDVPTGLTEEGVIGWFTFTERGGKWDVEARYEPTLVEIPPDPEATADGTPAEPAKGGVENYRLVDVAAELKRDDLSDQERSRLRPAFERTEGTMLNRGAAKDGLKPLIGTAGLSPSPARGSVPGPPRGRALPVSRAASRRSGPPVPTAAAPGDLVRVPSPRRRSGGEIDPNRNRSVLPEHVHPKT